MRDLLIFGVIFGLLPFVFKRPAIGALLFTWISLMNPHRLAYGAAYSFPFAAVVAAVTALATLMSKEKKMPWTPVTITLVLFYCWMNVSTLVALEPELVWLEWDRVTKTFFMVAITLMVINTEKDLKLFVWIVALSLGIYGLKGGLFTLASGGHYRVYGPDGSYIAENNSMALALVTTLPLIWYLRSLVKNRWIGLGLAAVAILSAVSAMGSYSRGALLGGVAMLLFLWLKSPKKLPTALAVIAMGALVAVAMPDAWYERMNTIENYQEDGSAMGRINAWHFAVNIATTHLLGGGFNVFSKRQFLLYAPNPTDYHVAHSIYFQVLGDQGFVGLALFLLLMFFAWRTGTRIIRFCKDRPDLKWASDLARMSQVSVIGYAVSGAFLSLAYFDLYYDIIIILVLLEKILMLKPKPALFPARVELAKSGG
ncbi:putative O-glycosylation ligase, exosortase A system-associated [Massilia sp. YIM B02763]|uniref:putative O-glycosylation ligase, exosortase A system-associated n=1 Tax=Massilia sp. YIM B02763 TaxID=3050130 RepID=UPI0025B6F4BA|nr:putative O-glycosylation ligase, exosortase A system-associated [Massilia sp. YIM B02763]MDN4053746.1 putative O-glycosylation ligase, exosortase A system-associated [Massilia sp. YIM B02763]